jgi:hypothetical protein
MASNIFMSGPSTHGVVCAKWVPVRYNPGISRHLQWMERRQGPALWTWNSSHTTEPFRQEQGSSIRAMLVEFELLTWTSIVSLAEGRRDV